MTEFVVSPGPEAEPWFEASPWGPKARIEVDRHAALVSLVGEGVVSEGDILRRAESSLSAAGIPALGVHTGTLSVSLLVPENRGEEASRILHRSLVSAE
jgi:aspartokinase